MNLPQSHDAAIRFLTLKAELCEHRENCSLKDLDEFMREYFIEPSERHKSHSVLSRHAIQVPDVQEVMDILCFFAALREGRTMDWYFHENHHGCLREMKSDVKDAGEDVDGDDPAPKNRSLAASLLGEKDHESLRLDDGKG